MEESIVSKLLHIDIDLENQKKYLHTVDSQIVWSIVKRASH